ncbi:MAG: hypothetical protein WDN04_07715 [Rhodospirillales bacterium]
MGTSAWADQASLLRLAWQVRSLGRTDMRELLRIIGMNVYDLAEEHFESNLVRGALGFDAVLGTSSGPRAPGTVLTLLYRMAAEAGAGPGAIAQPKGGMGALGGRAGRRRTGRRRRNPHRHARGSHRCAGGPRCRRDPGGWKNDRGRHGHFQRRPSHDFPEPARRGASGHRVSCGASIISATVA